MINFLMIAIFFIVSCQSSQDVIDERILDLRKRTQLITPPILTENTSRRTEKDFSNLTTIESQSPGSGSKRNLYPSMVLTNSELVGSSLGISSKYPQQLAKLDRELGVINESKIEKLPNFIVDLEEINNLFRRKEYEKVVIRVNYLLEFFPESPKLLVMIGTAYQIIGFFDVALRAYEKAFEISPYTRLKAQITYLRELLMLHQREG